MNFSYVALLLMYMYDGCIFSENGKCMVRIGKGLSPDSNFYICSKGSDSEKSKCPEWGPTIIVGNYYSMKLDAERWGEIK